MNSRGLHSASTGTSNHSVQRLTEPLCGRSKPLFPLIPSNQPLDLNSMRLFVLNAVQDHKQASFISNTDTVFHPNPIIEDFVTPEGTGYAQQNFKVSCSSCHFAITKDSLGIHRFLTSLADGAARGDPWLA
jgi:hypothetical protein